MRIEKFGASWCGPCKVMDRNLDEFAKKHPEVIINRHDVDEEEDTVANLGIKSVPTTFIYNDEDELLNKFVGVATIAQLELLL